MRLVSTVALVFAAGCGSISYGSGQMIEEEVEVSPGRWVLVQGQAQQPGVAVAQQQPRPMPPPPPVAMPAPPPRVAPLAIIAGSAPVQCSGNEQIRVHDQIVDGHGGAAVIASGNCVVIVSECIVRGTVHASGNASLRFVESRIEGDIHASGNARIESPGSRHRGRLFTL